MCNKKILYLVLDLQSKRSLSMVARTDTLSMVTKNLTVAKYCHRENNSSDRNHYATVTEYYK